MNKVKPILVLADDAVSSYGVFASGKRKGDLTEVIGLVEKPRREDAPSNRTITGRYILQPGVTRVVEKQSVGAGGEILLTEPRRR